MAKGPQFERDVCRRLSLWWTRGHRDDIFWRTAGSGGRATARAKKGKSTAGSAGDVMAIDPIGLPLLGLFAIELKRGYNRASIQDLLDVSSGKALYREWIVKARSARDAAGAKSWMIILRRDRRLPLVLFEENLECGSLLGLSLCHHSTVFISFRSLPALFLVDFASLLSIDPNNLGGLFREGAASARKS